MKRYRFSVPGVAWDVLAMNRWQALRRAVRWYKGNCFEVDEGDHEDSHVENIRLYVECDHRVTMADIVCVDGIDE